MPVLNYNFSDHSNVMVTSELESDDFVNNCRGQGSRYSEKCTETTVQLQNKQEDFHFNFMGEYKGLCCFCAVRIGLSSLSFADISCYHCKRRDMLYREFSKLRVARGSAAPCWDTHGWGALSDALIEYILAMALNNNVGEGGRVDRMLLDC